MLKSHRSKIDVYTSCLQVHELRQSHCGDNKEGIFIVFMIGYIYIYYIWYKTTHFSLHLYPAIQRMGNTPNILNPRRMEQVESHPHFIFYCKLSKVTLDYISELINLNYSFNLPFKFSLKTIKMGSFSILWWCTFKNSTHTFDLELHLKQ